jgi:hypothetical protein
MPTFSIVPTGIRPRYPSFDFGHETDPRAHISDSETITPSGSYFFPGDIITMVASQNRYSFDYYEVWAPNVVIESTCAYPTLFGFVASFDPRTKVQLNSLGDITGSNSNIIARYR